MTLTDIDTQPERCHRAYLAAVAEGDLEGAIAQHDALDDLLD